MGLFGATAVRTALLRWADLRREVDIPRAAHARQVHGARVLAHGVGPPGLLVSEGFDGHWTMAPGLLLSVSVADCVPIFLTHDEIQVVGILHAGWRGVAAGILEAGVRALAVGAGAEAGGLRMHLGPAICGECYEVGAEVHEALGLPAPEHPAPVDLRTILARRALSLGLPGERVTVSEWCTRCGEVRFFSHRRGDSQRQVAFIGIRSGA